MRPYWKPVPIWEGRPCYIVGGGSSLKAFNWDHIKGEAVLGCCAAFYLGPQIVPVTVFGDASFLKLHYDGLVKYVERGGKVFTNAGHRCKPAPPDWLHLMRKQVKGLAHDAIGWNKSTGAAAINLALIFGANPIYLLGYDMSVGGDGETHFHNAYNKKGRPKIYLRFQEGMKNVAEDLPHVFPGRQVINLEDGTSRLEVFPKQSLKAHFEKKEAA